MTARKKLATATATAAAAGSAAALLISAVLTPSAATLQDPGAMQTTVTSVEAVELEFVGVDAGDAFSLGWTSAGDLYSWGDNNRGQLGHGSLGGGALIPTPIKFPDEADISQAAAGTNLAIALAADGGVYTWGNPDILPNTSAPTRAPFFDSLGDPVVGVDAGGFFYLAWTASGRLYSWGEAGGGRLGRPGASNSAPAVVTAQGLQSNTVTFASAGRFQGTAIVAGQSAATAWGQGYGATSGSTIAGGVAPLVGIAAGTGVTLFWDSDGALYSSTGGPATAITGMPPTVSAALSTPTFGESSLYAWDASGSLFAWGRNDQGQLGLGTSGASVAAPTPVPLAPGSTVLDVGSGGEHSLYVGGDTTFSSAGANAAGQLGTGDTGPHNAFASGIPIFSWP